MRKIYALTFRAIVSVQKVFEMHASNSDTGARTTTMPSRGQLHCDSNDHPSSSDDDESASSTPLSQQDCSEWLDDSDNEEAFTYVPLFSIPPHTTHYRTIEEALAMDKEQTGFDIRTTVDTLGLSYLDVVQLVNYVRAGVAENERGVEGVVEALENVLSNGEKEQTSGGGYPWLDARYLVPVLEGDGMLAYDWVDDWDDKDTDKDGEGGGFGGYGKESEESKESRAADLQEVMRGLDLNDPAVMEVLVDGGHRRDIDIAVPDEHYQRRRAEAVSRTTDDIDDCYFASYSTFDIHREMLQDRVRTLAYQAALEKNPHLIKGSSVLDVGCGTGVLSMFAARGGAARVVGVDGSAAIAAVAKDLCTRNGFFGTVRVVSSRIEALCDEADTAQEALEEKLGGPIEFDVLVSEWMGYALLFESMLDSVLTARDRFLKPGGAVLPDVANMYVGLGAAGAEGLEFWDDVYGLDMGAVGGALREQGMRGTIIRVVEAENLLSVGVKFHSLDLATMTREEQDFSSAQFMLVPRELKEPKKNTLATCFVLWFDTEFSARYCPETPVVLGTGPTETPTHWAQTVLPLQEAVCLDSCEGVKGRISMSRQKSVHRTLDISLEYRRIGAGGAEGPLITQIYSIGVKE